MGTGPLNHLSPRKWNIKRVKAAFPEPKTKVQHMFFHAGLE
jgi:hypothetical protein